MNTVRLLLALALMLGTTLAEAADWRLVRNDKDRGIRVYLRETPGSEYHNFYAVTRVTARVSSVVAVLSDVAAMPEWIARLRVARQIRREGDHDVWVYGVYKLPYPFLEREAVLHSSLRQDKNGVVEVFTRAEKGFVPANAKRVRLLNMRGIWRLTPEANGQVKIEMWGEGDPGGYVPPVLFNYNLPDEPAQTLRHLRQMLTRDKYQKKTFPAVREP